MKIVGTGGALPQKIVTNEDLSKFLNTSDEWIKSHTGISQRRVMTKERLEQLAAQAALDAIADAGMDVGQIDYILCSNVYSAYITPGLSCVVQGLIGATCPCLDLNAACVGFVYALQVAQGLLKGDAKNILVLCAEGMSRMVNWEDRATCVLFGDGAGAVVVTADATDIDFLMGTKSNVDALYALTPPSNIPFEVPAESAQPLIMDGQSVFKFAVSSSVRDIKSLLERHKLAVEDIKYFLLHQANLRIIDAIQKRIGVLSEKLPTNIASHGNTSSATIPLLLNELNRKGALKSGDKIILSAFGAGLTTGACLLQWA